jgi:5-formyltetrahydrofolate cyclo-ligase
MRHRRRALGAKARESAALAVCSRLGSMHLLRAGMRVGMYLAVNGELDTAPLIALARRRGCQVFVPVIRSHRTSSMWFVPLGEALRANRYGAPEPASGRDLRISQRFLDLAIVPVVAFGASGQRLGSGAGYYDRAFAYLRTRCAWHKPLLVGVAYDWQLSVDLAAEPWDVPLAAVITDCAVHSFTPSIASSREPR